MSFECRWMQIRDLLVRFSLSLSLDLISRFNLYFREWRLSMHDSFWDSKQRISFYENLSEQFSIIIYPDELLTIDWFNNNLSSMYVHTRIASHSLNNASEKFLSFCNVNNNQSRESFSKIFPKFFKTLRKRIRGGRKQAFGNFATNLFHGIERE